MTSKTPIELLFDHEFKDASIARRLQVSRTTVSLWRSGKFKPSKRHQAIAAAYLQTFLSEISCALVAATWQKVSA